MLDRSVESALGRRWSLAAAPGLVVSLLFRSAKRRGLAPATLGVVASAVVLAGKFALESDAITYTGALALGVATVWNAWPVKRAASCEQCGTECEESPT